MNDVEIFIIKVSSIDANCSSTISARNVTALDHKIGDNSMEFATYINFFNNFLF